MAGSGLVACLWVWTAAGALAAGHPGKPAADDATAYGRALESFNRGDDARALAQLEHAPAGGTPRAQADIHNLRGAIYLRQGRYDQAQADFARASTLDYSLWAARFNEAEVSFRQKHYAESRRQFAALLDGTNRLFHPGEHRFVQYKLLLAGVCAGDDKPALAFIVDHRDDAQPPLAWYYLNAALEHRHGHAQKAEQWIAQADSTVGAGAGRTYAESFERLGWGTAGLPARPDPATRNVTIADNTLTRTPPSVPRPRAAEVGPEATLAVVEVLPDAPKPDLRASSQDFGPRPHGRPAASDAVPAPADAADTLPSVVDLPPGADDPAAAFAEILRTGRDNGPAPLARPRKGKATPSPSPSASPGAVTANQGGTPAPSAGPASSPSSEFTEKYEAAYVKFLEKNYPETLGLLDEADKVQPGQGQSVSLRFKSYYALAYLAYRKQDYPGALAELDHADQTQKNADSFNLRGLIFSKQHNYDQAEAMFHKAIVTDTGLWAAKFNYAELPFNRGNYTDARTRFEELYSQTDAAKQPREAELTQYKVFLTLLLEGKVEAASTFMDHLNFSGATPARYFCNAALNFRAGSVDRAKNWIDDAKKEYPPQLVAIFIESFYRLGWMADPNAPPGTMVAQATPAGTPAVTTSGTQPTTVATATAAPSASPSATVVASASAFPTPIIVVAAGPTPPPLATPAPFKPSPAVAAASPSATAVAVATPTPLKPSPAVVAATASPSATTVAVATPSATPRPTATATPVVAVATPTPTPRPTATASPAVAVVTPSPTAAPTRPAVAVATPSTTVTPAATPVRSVALASATPSVTPRASATAPAVVLAPTPTVTPARTATPVVAQVTPAPSATPVIEAAAPADQQARKKRRHAIVALVLVLGQTIYYVSEIRSVLARRKQRGMRAAARRRETMESSK